ncbi:MAG: DUF2281 domain-containing protein [Cyanothece sp. SIO2G6]|nr:DUF2281 domain-containing protein [Cyanothece sp. SIO2G6]
MDTKTALLQEIESVSDELLTQVLDFVQFLKYKHETEQQDLQQDLADAHAAIEEAKQHGTTSLADFKQELGV